MTRMDKSFIVAIWTNSLVLIPHPWISTCPLSESVEGEAQLQAYMQVQQVSNATDPLMWWKQHQQEFPRARLDPNG